MMKERLLRKTTALVLLLLCGMAMAVAQPGGRHPGGRPGRYPGQRSSHRRPTAAQMQSVRQKKVVNDSTMLKVVGTLVDSTNDEAMLFVNVAVMSQQDSHLVRGAVTDEKGQFEAKNLTKGDYYLQISSVGYETRRVPFSLSNNMSMGIIKLKPGAALLEAVNITAEKPMFAMEGEKMIYNVSQDPSVQDGTTSDALQNAPGVEVDIEGNVTLRGTSSVEIWINDRPSKLTAENLKTYLETLPANALDHIEVISNPSAKYATSSDAVINIITTAHIKKNHFVSFGLSGDSQKNLRPWASYMWANEKFSINLFGNLGYRHKESETGSHSVSRRLNAAGGYDTIQMQSDTGSSDSKTLRGGLFMNFNWYIDSLRELGGWGGVNGNFGRSVAMSEVMRDQTWDGGNLYRYHNDNSDTSNATFGFLGLNYLRKFDDEGHNLRLFLNSNFGTTDQNSIKQRDYTTLWGDDYNKYYHTVSGNHNIGLTARYNRPLSEATELSFGAGLDFNQSRGSYDPAKFDSIAHDYILVDSLRSYNYSETGEAANIDATLTQRWGAFTAEVGLAAALEHSSILYDNLLSDDIRMFHDDTAFTFFHVTPSLHLSYYTEDMHNFSFSYTLHKRTPSGSNLTTFRSYTEDSYSVGNRNLKSALSHQMEAGWSKYFTDFGFVGIDLYGNYSNNEIGSLLDVTPNVDDIIGRVITFTQSQNIGYSYRYGVQLHSTYRPNGFFNLRLGANLYDYGYHMEQGMGKASLDASKWSYSLRLHGWWKFKENYQFFFGGRYASPTISLASISKARYGLNFGVRADFFKKKMSAYVMVQDIFNWGYKYGSGSQNTNPTYLSTSTTRELSSRYISFGLTFRFGKLELESRAKEGDSTGEESETM